MTAGTLEINGASIKTKMLLNVYPSGTECNNNNRSASARHSSQAHFSHQTQHNLYLNQNEFEFRKHTALISCIGTGQGIFKQIFTSYKTRSILNEQPSVSVKMQQQAFYRCTTPQGVAVGLKLHLNVTILFVLEMKR